MIPRRDYTADAEGGERSATRWLNCKRPAIAGRLPQCNTKIGGKRRSVNGGIALRMPATFIAERSRFYKRAFTGSGPVFGFQEPLVDSLDLREKWGRLFFKLFPAWNLRVN